VDLADRLEAVGRALGEREAAHAQELASAQKTAELLHASLAEALARFHAAVREAGAPHLEVTLSAPRLDEKHVRAFELELARGRHRGLVVVKSRGEVTLVGPFRTGKTEGPCRSFPVAARADIESALSEFLVRFLEEAATP